MSKTKESNKQTETLTTRSGSDLLVEALVHEDVDFILDIQVVQFYHYTIHFMMKILNIFWHVMNKVLPMPLKDTHVFLANQVSSS